MPRAENVERIDTGGLGLPREVERPFRDFCRGLLAALGEDEVRSITVYGSVARKEYFPGRSDVNTLVVVKSADPEVLRRAADVVHEAAETCGVTAFFLTPEDIETSRDVFPIKFHDMRDAYVVVYGADVLSGLEISDANERLELEQEMKILLLELRQFHLHRARGGAPGGGGAEHLIAYVNAFLYLMKRLVMLEGAEPPKALEDLVAMISRRYGLDAEAMSHLLEFKRGKPLRSATEEAAVLYRAVARAADVIDKLDTKA